MPTHRQNHIKKCPFCGGKAAISFSEQHGTGWREYWVECNNCEIHSQFFDTENKAIKAWNQCCEPLKLKPMQKSSILALYNDYADRLMLEAMNAINIMSEALGYDLIVEDGEGCHAIDLQKRT